MSVYLKGLEDGKEKMKECYDSVYKSRCKKATNYYLKELAKNKSVNDVAVKMFNILEGNINESSCINGM